MQRVYKIDYTKVPIIDPDNWLQSDSTDNRIVCLSDRDVFVIRSYLFPFATWHTRFSRRIEGEVHEASTDSELSQFVEFLDELDYKLTGGDFMACLDTGLLAIAESLRAIANRPCCGSTVNLTVNGGVVTEWIDRDGITRPIYGTEPPIVWENGEFPPGFESKAEYELNKCQVSNGVFEGWVSALRGFARFTVFNATALATLIGLAIPGILAFPPAAIPVMIGLLIVLGVNIVILDQVADGLEANRESIICDLYNSETVESMTSVLGDALDGVLALIGTSSVIGAIVKQVALLLVNGDTLNQLMSGIASYSYPDADCTECGPCSTIIPNPGSGPNAATVILDESDHYAEVGGGAYNDRARWDLGAGINAQDTTWAYCGPMVSITELALLTGSFITGTGTNEAGWVIFDQSFTEIYRGASPTLPIVGAFVGATSGEAITFKVRWQDIE